MSACEWLDLVECVIGLEASIREDIGSGAGRASYWMCV